ncbi:hypothetical protein K470DRAFT_263016 [Piedraia hortae CBS 480.64]|uniref:Uncharacterized protein n=1 Tax=Piedraia hortae CBS 480.64 TaxID=1314780 RepID=A0A6A7C3T8_9PEZI|nr:hypothetical protein K470DRAFT_263016 [Piedraia hortae CBS 480.64]
MHLVSLGTATQPFKALPDQEATLISILRFMAEHDPPLHINREGYRAVIRVQLGQEKTNKEQQWAQLKLLSWPPWKSERTAMDADITHYDHGISRAARTLRRMYEAGYSPTNWEKTAQLYAGWDVDGTPTIQSRVILGTHFGSESALWTARISTTRTAQEAWAAFLAYQDTKLGYDSEVYLAILKRLHGEEKRHHQKINTSLLPGDSPDVQPLPPSTHLYTYTRTPVPSLENFIDQSINKGIKFNSRCLSFIITTATSLKQGIKYLSISKNSEVKNLLTGRGSISHIPTPILISFISLLCRHSATSLSKALRSVNLNPHHGSYMIFNERINADHPLALVMWILIRRCEEEILIRGRNALLLALSKDATVRGLVGLFLQGGVEMEGVAYRFAWAVMETINLPMDDVAFRAVCLVVEKLAGAVGRGRVGSPRVDAPRVDTPGRAGNSRRVADPRMEPPRVDSLSMNPPGRMNSIRPQNLPPKPSPTQKLETLFNSLVEDTPTSTILISNQPANPTQDYPPLPIPHPVSLHAYIRALGVWGDDSALLRALEYICAHKDQLEALRDRNAERLVRRCLVACRLFLRDKERGREVVEGVGWVWPEEGEVGEYLRGG